MKTKIAERTVLTLFVGLSGLALVAGCQPSATENPSTIESVTSAEPGPTAVTSKPDAPQPGLPATNQPGANQPGANEPATNAATPTNPQ